MRKKKRLECPLLERTIELLKSCGKSTAEVASDTGLPIYWINSIRWNEGIDPMVTRTIKLYEYLTGKKLEIN